MKIDLVLSDLTKSATSKCLEEVVFSAEKNKFENHYVIVPETKSIIIEQELLKLSSVGAFDNVYVYSFVRLLSKLTRIDESKILNKQSAIMILRKIINETERNFICYKRTARLVGFAEKIYETIQQFKSSNLLPEDVKQAANVARGALKAKLLDLALIFDEYENVIGGKFYDDCDKLRILSAISRTNSEIKSSHFYVVGFDNITPEMSNVLTDIAANAKSICFSSVYFNDKKPNKLIQKNELVTKFKKIADRLKYPYNAKYVESSLNGDFNIAKNSLFSFGNKNYKYSGNIKIFEASNVREEVDFVANKIIDEVKTGKRFNEIGVLLTDFEKYAEKIKDCFSSYGLPYFLNEKQDISSHTLVELIKSYFSLYQSNLQAEDVIRFCSSAFFKFDGLSKFINFIYAKGINYADFLSVSAEDERVNEILNFVKNTFVALKEKLQNCKKINQYLQILTDFLSKIDAKGKLAVISEHERQSGLVVEAEISSVIFSKLEEFNLMVGSFLGETDAELREFLQIYFSGFESIKLNLAPLSIDSIIIGDSTDGFWGLKEMFVVGANEGSFPKKLQDTGIILDSELQETTKIVGKEIEPLIEEINAREQFKTYESIFEPTEKLYLSYAIKDVGGAVNKPSSIIEEIRNLFGNGVELVGYDSNLFASKKGFEFRFAKHICKALNGAKTISSLNEEYSILSGDISEELMTRINEINSKKQFKPISRASELYFNNNLTSVTQLKTYFSCPYQFFANYGLRLIENKQAKLSSIDVGVIIHKIVELFAPKIDKLKGKNESEIDKEIIDVINQALVLKKVNCDKNKSIVHLIEIEALKLCRYLFFEQQHSNFKIFKNEFEFHGNNAIKIKLNNEKTILIEGKIDRIDKYNNFIRIIDYKTGEISSDLSSMYYGKNIQLITYLSATSNTDEFKVAGLFYFPVQASFAKDEKTVDNFYQMQGFVIDDIDVIKNMDTTLGEQNLSSKFFPAKIKITNEGFEIADASAKQYMSANDFATFDNYNRQLCKNAIKEILSGNIEPAPPKEKSESHMMCESCKLAGYCGVENAKFSKGRELNQKVEIQSFNCEEVEDDRR